MPSDALSEISAMFKQASSRPPDEPQDEGALRAVVERSEASLPDAPKSVAPFLWIHIANAKRLLGNDDEAMVAFDRATSLDSSRADFWFDWALAHQWALRFERARDALLRVLEIEGNSVRAKWNLALCETALGHGARALHYWRELGIEGKLTPSGMPVIEGLEPAEVRARTATTGHQEREGIQRFEVLAVQPLSPVHGVVTSPSYGHAACDYGDVVLWQSPIGARVEEGKTIPRFALMAVLHKGRERKFPFIALTQTPEAFSKWAGSLDPSAHVFHQQERLEWICNRCAAGDVMTPHSHEKKEQHRLIFGKIIVGEDANLAAFARDFEEKGRQNAGVAVAMPALYEAVGDTAKAGKAHKAWAALAKPKN